MLVYMMSCGTGKMTRKKIAIFSGAGAITATVFYFAFATHNPALAAVAPMFLTLGLCPALCAGIGGAVWFRNRLIKKKN